MTTNKNGQKLKSVLAGINRNLGPGSIFYLSDKPLDVQRFATGSLTVDLAVGGGFPVGRVVEIYGPEMSGKTTLALHAIAEAQKAGGRALFVDVEHALDPEYAASIGVNVEELFICQPDNAEMALDIVDMVVKSGAFNIVVIDSVASLCPKEEMDGEMGDNMPGLLPRLMSRAMRKLVGSGAISKSKCSLLLLNQLRIRPDVIYGSPEYRPGGRAIQFYASVALDLRRIHTLKFDGQEIGARIKVKCSKNKVAPPFRAAEFDLIFGKGIDSFGCLRDLALETGVIYRSGCQFRHGSQVLGRSAEETARWLEENYSGDLVQSIERETKLRLAL